MTRPSPASELAPCTTGCRPEGECTEGECVTCGAAIGQRCAGTCSSWDHIVHDHEGTTR